VQELIDLVAGCPETAVLKLPLQRYSDGKGWVGEHAVAKPGLYVVDATMSSDGKIVGLGNRTYGRPRLNVHGRSLLLVEDAKGTSGLVATITSSADTALLDRCRRFVCSMLGAMQSQPDNRQYWGLSLSFSRLRDSLLSLDSGLAFLSHCGYIREGGAGVAGKPAAGGTKSKGGSASSDARLVLPAGPTPTCLQALVTLRDRLEEVVLERDPALLRRRYGTKSAAPRASKGGPSSPGNVDSAIAPQRKSGKVAAGRR
jgi:hypothetical protein